MINSELFESNIKKDEISNCYIFCGLDEQLIKENIKKVVKKVVDDKLLDLNYIKIDGLNCSFEDIFLACETMSFFGDKKVILVYRANFLNDKTDKKDEKTYKDILNYTKDLPQNSILIMYYCFNNKRDTPKKNKKLIELSKYVTLVHCGKLRNDNYYKKVDDLFLERNRKINKIQLKYFADKVQNNFDIIKNEIDKLLDYVGDREITREDIDKLIFNKSEDDIFDLVEYISNGKAKNALNLLDELLFKQEQQYMIIIASIQNHFKRLFEIKVHLENGEKLNFFIKKYRLPEFVCEKLIIQSRKFTLKQLKEFIDIVVNSERRLKTISNDKDIEMELMLFKTFLIKK